MVNWENKELNFGGITEDPVIETITYRGYEVPVYLNESGQCFYTLMNDEFLGFGSFNTEYRGDIEYIINKYLDTIYDFSEEDKKYHGAFLEYFDNSGFTDIQVKYRQRILKIFLVDDKKLTDEEKENILKESREILDIVLN